LHINRKLQKEDIVKQLLFDFMFEQFSQEKIHLERKIKKELVFIMAETIIDIYKNEKGKTDDNLSE